MRRPLSSADSSSSAGRAHQNEYAENQRLWEEAECGSPRRAFTNALRAYVDAEGGTRQAKLIEAVIRTSRGVHNDDSVLQREDRAALEAIAARYRLFASVELPAFTRSHSDARNLIKSLFF